MMVFIRHILFSLSLVVLALCLSFEASAKSKWMLSHAELIKLPPKKQIEYIQFLQELFAKADQQGDFFVYQPQPWSWFFEAAHADSKIVCMYGGLVVENETDSCEALTDLGAYFGEASFYNEKGEQLAPPQLQCPTGTGACNPFLSGLKDGNIVCNPIRDGRNRVIQNFTQTCLNSDTTQIQKLVDQNASAWDVAKEKFEVLCANFEKLPRIAKRRGRLSDVQNTCNVATEYLKNLKAPSPAPALRSSPAATTPPPPPPAKIPMANEKPKDQLPPQPARSEKGPRCFTGGKPVPGQVSCYQCALELSKAKAEPTKLIPQVNDWWLVFLSTSRMLCPERSFDFEKLIKTYGYCYNPPPGVKDDKPYTWDFSRFNSQRHEESLVALANGTKPNSEDWQKHFAEIYGVSVDEAKELLCNDRNSFIQKISNLKASGRALNAPFAQFEQCATAAVRYSQAPSGFGYSPRAHGSKFEQESCQVIPSTLGQDLMRNPRRPAIVNYDDGSCEVAYDYFSEKVKENSSGPTPYISASTWTGTTRTFFRFFNPVSNQIRTISVDDKTKAIPTQVVSCSGDDFARPNLRSTQEAGQQ